MENIKKAVPVENDFVHSNKVCINLFSVEMIEPVSIKLVDEKCEGNFDSIKWPELKKFGMEIHKLLTSQFEIFDLAVDMKPYYRLQELQYYSGISIGLLDVELPQEKHELIISACILLINNIIGSEGTGTQVSLPRLGEVTIQQIGEQSDKFLEKFGGGKIRTPIKITGNNFTINSGGRFKEKPSAQIFVPIAEKIYGKVDGISLHARKFEIIELEKGTKIAVLFDLNIHFENLRILLGEEAETGFIIQKELDGKAVAVNTLLGIDLAE